MYDYGNNTAQGSPPRMRGKAGRCHQRQHQGGITPAYAGKSRSIPEIAKSSQDHPRVCGEKAGCPRGRLRASGSPPRMRGKACLTSLILIRARITPAYAGKRCSQSPLPPQTRDHPRVCGEKKQTEERPLPGQGSPPRMRGKEKRPPRLLRAAGITPAYAGKSQFPADILCLPWDHPRVCGEKTL